MRTHFSKKNIVDETFKNQLLNWAQQFREVLFLDSNDANQTYSNFDFLLAVDAFTAIRTDFKNAFIDLNEYQRTVKDWIFGYLTYDLKNDVETLQSNNRDGLSFPDLYFFQPKKIFIFKNGQLELHYLSMCDDEMEADLEAILTTENKTDTQLNNIQINQRISQEDYLIKVHKLLEYIQQGEVYEANFCMEFFAEKARVSPLEIYQKLNALSKPPFAVFFKNNCHYLLSASPERYLKKKGTKIISQPIKGTSKRFLDPELDQKSKIDLAQSQKERSENIMIVDLVRNDLSKTAIKNSVTVEELCQIYTFQQVHQMISTVTATVSPAIAPTEIIRTTFPMGSMTGAPKIAAMKIIEELEETKRGLYSGAIGYFDPNGDFDFNVVIRSILYNQMQEYLSFSVGSAITALAIPEEEYAECLLKAKAMFEVLQ